jgi:hypothetical protein
MVECVHSGWSLRLWRDGRVDEGGCLENSCGATHRGFESLSLRLKNGEVPEWLNGGAC